MRTQNDRLSRVLFTLVAILALGFGSIWVGCTDTSQPVISPAAPEASGALSKGGQLQDAIGVQNRHTERLLAISGVLGTATGATEDGRPTILIFTEEQGARGVLPRELEGVPVVVKATGTFVAFQESQGKGGKPGGQGGGPNKINPTDRFDRPVPIGVSTGNAGECSAGTIGCRVQKGTTVYALSNNHVYALQNNASIGSEVVQPGRYDSNCSTDPANVIGTLADFEPIVFSSSANNKIDAAIATTTTSKLANSTPSNGYGTPSSTTISAAVNQKVQKYGRTTSLTKGIVTGINATVRVNYGSSGIARFVDQIIIVGGKGPFSKAGDSGSLVVTDDNNKRPVGLLFAGSPDGTTIANRIDLVLSKFGVTVDGQ